MGKPKLFLIGVGAFALVACATGPKRSPNVQPPSLAFAPQPLPLSSYRPLLDSGFVPAPNADDVLISQAEGFYQAGLSDYRSGNLEKAKEEFDQAVGLFLESKLDLEGEERLKEEFSRLLEDIHGWEVAALERGDTLNQHNEPAPIESLAGLTFPVDPRVKQHVERELRSVRSDLPLVSNDLVAGVTNYFQFNKGGQAFIHQVLERSGLYHPTISEALRQEGLPEDLIYLAGAESAFDPFARSRKGAKGIWQLMLGRALDYGLKKDRWVDEREDPVKSSSAAARHLKDLYEMFGDWYLAMAAYNAGPVAVQRAIEKTGYADFWALRQLHALPKETENYVPIILATALIAKDPKSFGFDVQPDSPLTPDQVVVKVPTDIRLIAQLIDRPVEELIKLNPSLLGWTTPANDSAFVLNLPPGTRETYDLAIVSIPAGKRIWWRAHKVEGGETVSTLARKFHVSTVALAQANQIERSTPLIVGSRLLVPLAPGSQASLRRVRERVPRRAYHYRVRKGDTLELIADRFNVTPYQIRRWNGLKTSRLFPGRTLVVFTSARGSCQSRAEHARRRTSSRKSLARKNLTPPSSSQASSRPPTTPQGVTPGPRAAR